MENVANNIPQNGNLQQGAVIRWVAVEDKLPPQKRVLIYMVFNHHKTIGIGGYDEDNGWMSRGEKVPVTHWAELPPPPCV